MPPTARRSAPIFVFALLTVAAPPAMSGEEPHVLVECMSAGDNCQQRMIRLPDGLPGQVLKFEYCREGDCDRSHRERWITHYLVPPPGEVCRNSDVGEALRWLEQNHKGWLLAGWGCVSKRQLPA